MAPPGISSLWFSFVQSRPGPEARTDPNAGLDFDAGINTSAAWTGHIDADNTPTQPFTDGPEPSSSPKLHSLSDDEPEDDEIEEGEQDGRPARVLYGFEGKPEFRELVVESGEEIEVLKEEVGDGWSLVRNVAGEMGLLPRAYYTFTIDFLVAPEGAPPTFSKIRRRDASATSLTPRGSPTQTSQQLPSTPELEAPSTSSQPIQLQTTGERMLAAFPSFRQSLLGGKNLNRFSAFVTSGAEDYVLKGAGGLSEEHVLPPTMRSLPTSHERNESEESSEGSDSDIFGEEKYASSGQKPTTSEADRHYVESGPSWKSKVPPFRVLVHSPSRRSSTLSGAFTVYSVTSLFQMLPDPSSPDYDPEAEPQSPMRITVYRRFSHFVVLHTALTRRLPGLALPPLPEKQYAGRFNDDFVEARRGDLERYLARIVRHPVARYAEFLTFFLGCESEIEWKRQLPRHLALPPAGSSFYANVFHPAFNLDAEEAGEAVERFETHTKAVGLGIQGLRNAFGQIRQARVEMSKAERLLSYSLLSLITSKPLATTPNGPVYPAHLDPLYEPEYDVEDDQSISETTSIHKGRASDKTGRCRGLSNEEGAWCWREGCEECLELTKAMQKTSEALQSVADLYDDHARRTQLVTHEALKGVAHPTPTYAPVIDTHRNALSRYSEATRTDNTDDKVAARCETVLNTTMAEMEIYHSQKVEDFTQIAKEHLDGEIEFYEQILNRLHTARRAYDQPVPSHTSNTPSTSSVIPPGPRQQSIYERELAHPRLNPDPLPQPCPHVYDSAPMRPVSHAIQQGVGLFLGGSVGSGLGISGGAGRTSVLGRFGWGI